MMARKSGGFGCGIPKINERIDLSTAAARIYGKRTCYADALFMGRSGRLVDVEPGGETWHAGETNWRSDNRRRQALEHDGYEVVALSWEDFTNYERWGEVGARVARSLWLYPRPISKRMESRRHLVHGDLTNTELLRESFGPTEGDEEDEKGGSYT